MLAKVYFSQSYDFSSSHVWIWKLDHKEDWVLKNWYFQIVVLEKTLENPLESKEIKPVNPKGNQPWIFIGRTDAEVPILCPPDAKSQRCERLKTWEEGGDRGWDGCMASPTQWTWIGENFGRWWRLACCSPWDHRVRNNLVTEQRQCGIFMIYWIWLLWLPY